MSNLDAEQPLASPAERGRIIIFGAAGGLGRLLCRRLHRQHDVISVDPRPFSDRPKDIQHHTFDVRRRAAAIELRKVKPTAIIHVGMHSDDPRGLQSPLVAVDTVAALIDLADQCKVNKFVFVSSATLYGASATSSSFLTEEAPLLAANRFPELGQLISIDMMVQASFWKRPDEETLVLRLAHTVGPHLRNAPTLYLRRNTIPTLLGYDPMIQLLHEDDAVEAICASLTSGVRGVVNVAGKEQAPLSRIIAARGAQSFPLPAFALRALLNRTFTLGVSRPPEGETDFLRYSLLVDDTRARQILHFTPRHSLLSTLADLA